MLSPRLALQEAQLKDDNQNEVQQIKPSFFDDGLFCGVLGVGVVAVAMAECAVAVTCGTTAAQFCSSVPRPPIVMKQTEREDAGEARRLKGLEESKKKNLVDMIDPPERNDDMFGYLHPSKWHGFRFANPIDAKTPAPPCWSRQVGRDSSPVGSQQARESKKDSVTAVVMTLHSASRVEELQELGLVKQLYAAYHGYTFYFGISDEWDGFFPTCGVDRLFKNRPGFGDNAGIPGEFVKAIAIWEVMVQHAGELYISGCYFEFRSYSSSLLAV